VDLVNPAYEDLGEFTFTNYETQERFPIPLLEDVQRMM
jgi:hypothetical protein